MRARLIRRDPRLVLGAFFALVAAIALAVGLGHRGPATLDTATSPRPHPAISTGTSPLPSDTPTAPATTATPPPPSTATPAGDELAAARTTPGRTAAATASPTSQWVEATAVPPTSTPAPPTQRPGPCGTSVNGNCEFPPPTP